VRVDAVSVFLLDVAEASAQRFLLVRPVDALCEPATEDSSALVRVELERRPRYAVVDALVQSDRVVRSTRSTELQTDVRNLGPIYKKIL